MTIEDIALEFRKVRDEYDMSNHELLGVWERYAEELNIVGEQGLTKESAFRLGCLLKDLRRDLEHYKDKYGS